MLGLSKFSDYWTSLFKKDDQGGIGEHLNVHGVSASGKSINSNNAMEITSVYSAVRVIAETIASLPLHLMIRDGDIRRIASENPLNFLVKDSPNDWMTSFSWRETCQGHLCLRGNSFSEVDRDGSGVVQKIIPLNPDHVGIFKVGDEVLYSYKDRPLLAENVLHIQGIGCDGVIGSNPIRLMRNALGLTATVDEYGSQLFANGASVAGALKVDANLDETQFKRLRDQWNDRYQGLKKAGSTAILEKGMSWQSIGLTSDDAQFLDTRKFQKTEIASMFRVPPHLIGDLSRATFSNIEHQSIEFVTHTIRPWVVRWEQALNRVLLTECQRAEGYYFKFNVDGLLRGDIKSRYEAYAKGISAGFLTRNEARSFEDLNPIEGLSEPLTPLNMTTGDSTNEE